MKGSLLQAACGMEIFMNSIIGNKKARSAVEQTAEIIFTICAFFAVLAVISITVYMFLNGTPALTKVGLTEILFSTVWKPTAADPSYGILYVILTSIVGTTLAILLGVPIGVLTAVFLAETMISSGVSLNPGITGIRILSSVIPEAAIFFAFSIDHARRLRQRQDLP